MSLTAIAKSPAAIGSAKVIVTNPSVPSKGSVVNLRKLSFPVGPFEPKAEPIGVVASKYSPVDATDKTSTS